MKRELLSQGLREVAEEEVPADIDLWPAIQTRLNPSGTTTTASVKCPAKVGRPGENALSSLAGRARRKNFSPGAALLAVSSLLIFGVWLSARTWEQVGPASTERPAATLASTMAITPLIGTQAGDHTPTLTATPEGSSLREHPTAGTTSSILERPTVPSGEAPSPASLIGWFGSGSLSLPTALPASQPELRRS